MRQRTIADKVERLVPAPARPPVRIAVAVDERRAGTADRPRLLKHATAKRHIEHAPAVVLVPASDDDARGQPVLVLVYKLLEQVGRDFGRRLHFLGDRVELQVVRDNVCECLRVCRRARAAAVDAVREVRQLVGDTVRLRKKKRRTMYGPMVVRESAPITTPPSNATAMIEVCGEGSTYAEVDLALLEARHVDRVHRSRALASAPPDDPRDRPWRRLAIRPWDSRAHSC